jgi:hypothetical protein
MWCGTLIYWSVKTTQSNNGGAALLEHVAMSGFPPSRINAELRFPDQSDQEQALHGSGPDAAP